jgi:predicted RNase H-like HicB family nuclease
MPLAIEFSPFRAGRETFKTRSQNKAKAQFILDQRAKARKEGNIMKYIVFVKPEPEGGYVANVLGWSLGQAHGETETEAVEQARAMLENALATGKFVSIEIQPEAEGDRRSPAWWQSHVVGRLADDPTAAEWMEEMARIRQEANQVEAGE